MSGIAGNPTYDVLDVRLGQIVNMLEKIHKAMTSPGYQEAYQAGFKDGYNWLLSNAEKGLEKKAEEGLK